MKFLLALLPAGICAAPLALQLPTENHHLFSNEPQKFYMYVDRYFEGNHTQPWEGGSYGYVRTSVKVQERVIQTKFHEGIDIAPIKRDKAGNPLDLIYAIADGKVAYVSDVTSRSNYGKYIVVEHNWENSSVYSLYAHLAKITCKAGDPVAKGAVLGQMGYTGAGITRVRAHVHLELALMLSGRYDEYAPSMQNFHGPFNGMNLVGLDVAGFILAHKAKPSLTLPQYLSSYPVYFKVTIPNNAPIEMAVRYPWLLRSNSAKSSPSWEISFSNTGMPLTVAASERRVTQPTLTAVRPSSIPHRYLTRGLLTGEGKEASLAPGGTALVNLLSGNFPAVSEGEKNPELTE